MQHLITATIHYKKCIYGIICSRIVVVSMSSGALIVYVHIYIQSMYIHVLYVMAQHSTSILHNTQLTLISIHTAPG